MWAELVNLLVDLFCVCLLSQTVVRVMRHKDVAVVLSSDDLSCRQVSMRPASHSQILLCDKGHCCSVLCRKVTFTFISSLTRRCVRSSARFHVDKDCLCKWPVWRCLSDLCLCLQPSLNPEGGSQCDIVLLNRWSVRNFQVQRGNIVSIVWVRKGSCSFLSVYIYKCTRQ